jgi:hypothetical protein
MGARLPGETGGRRERRFSRQCLVGALQFGADFNDGNGLAIKRLGLG